MHEDWRANAGGSALIANGDNEAVDEGDESDAEEGDEVTTCTDVLLLATSTSTSSSLAMYAVDDEDEESPLLSCSISEIARFEGAVGAKEGWKLT